MNKRYTVKEATGKQRIVARRATWKGACAVVDRQPADCWIIDRQRVSRIYRRSASR